MTLELSTIEALAAGVSVVVALAALAFIIVGTGIALSDHEQRRKTVQEKLDEKRRK